MPELDAETKARIEAEEAYRAQVRAGQAAPPAPQAPAPQAPAPKRAGCGTWILVAFVGLILVGVLGQLGLVDTSSTTSTPSSSVETGAASEATSWVTPPEANPWGYEGLGDGTRLVGSEIQPGRYRTRAGSPGCYWARLAGTSGELADVNANENERGPAIVDISEGDRAFETRGCAPWTTDVSALRADPSAPFEDGTYLVGTDVAAGTWRSNSPEDCYWARLSGFGGGMGALTANDNGNGLVTISSDDVGFRTSRCGTWTKIE